MIGAGVDVAGDLTELAGRLEDVTRDALEDAGELARDVTLAAAARRRSVSGLPGRLDVDVRVDGAGVELVHVPARAWSIVDDGTAPHEIRPRLRRAVLTPRGPRRTVHHPGAAGAGITDRAAGDVDQAVESAIAEHYDRWIG